MELTINGRKRKLDVEPEMPLLWVLRDELGLTGAKFGCGIGACGACSVLLDGKVARSCIVPCGSVGAKRVTTIEGLSGVGDRVKQAWIAAQVPQCGYCQTGMIMAATSLLTQQPRPDDAAIDGAMTNICRCGTYGRIKLAIRQASDATTPEARKL